MTDNAEKNAYENYDDYPLTSEDLVEPRDTYTRMKCLKCGYEENLPDWILDEFCKEDRMNSHNDRQVSTECQRCNHAMFKNDK